MTCQVADGSPASILVRSMAPKKAAAKEKPSGSGRKVVGHHVVGIGPDAVVRIVAEIAVRHGKRVAA